MKVRRRRVVLLLAGVLPLLADDDVLIGSEKLAENPLSAAEAPHVDEDEHDDDVVLSPKLPQHRQQGAAEALHDDTLSSLPALPVDLYKHGNYAATDEQRTEVVEPHTTELVQEDNTNTNDKPIDVINKTPIDDRTSNDKEELPESSHKREETEVVEPHTTELVQEDNTNTNNKPIDVINKTPIDDPTENDKEDSPESSHKRGDDADDPPAMKNDEKNATEEAVPPDPPEQTKAAGKEKTGEASKESDGAKSDNSSAAEMDANTTELPPVDDGLQSAASDSSSNQTGAKTDETATEKPTDETEEDGPIERHVVDYASKSAGALILEKSSTMKGTSNLLNSDKDKYAIAPCEDKKFVVVGLSEDILVKQVRLANYERYSSRVENFQILGSQDMKSWADLGTYTAQPGNGDQAFDLLEPAWARYLKFRFLTHYGSEHYCTVSQIKVHGSTMLQGFQEQWRESEAETQKILSEVDDKIEIPMEQQGNREEKVNISATDVSQEDTPNNKNESVQDDSSKSNQEPTTTTEGVKSEEKQENVKNETSSIPDTGTDAGTMAEAARTVASEAPAVETRNVEKLDPSAIQGHTGVNEAEKVAASNEANESKPSTTQAPEEAIAKSEEPLDQEPKTQSPAQDVKIDVASESGSENPLQSVIEEVESSSNDLRHAGTGRLDESQQSTSSDSSDNRDARKSQHDANATMINLPDALMSFQWVMEAEEKTETLTSASIEMFSNKSANAERSLAALDTSAIKTPSSGQDFTSMNTISDAASTEQSGTVEIAKRGASLMKDAIRELQMKIKTRVGGDTGCKYLDLDETPSSQQPGITNLSKCDSLQPASAVGSSVRPLSSDTQTKEDVDENVESSSAAKDDKGSAVESGQTDLNSKNDSHASSVDEASPVPDSSASDQLSATDAENPPQNTEEVRSNGLGVEMNTAISHILEKFPSAECLETLNYPEFKAKIVAARTGAKATGSSSGAVGPASGATSGSGKMEPIFKTLTDEIKTLQINQSVHDQFTKALVSCYQRVLLDMAAELEAVHADQTLRLSLLEDAVREMKTQSWTAVLGRMASRLIAFCAVSAVSFHGWFVFVSELASLRLKEMVMGMKLTALIEDGVGLVCALCLVVLLVSRRFRVSSEAEATRGSNDHGPLEIAQNKRSVKTEGLGLQKSNRRRSNRRRSADQMNHPSKSTNDAVEQLCPDRRTVPELFAVPVE